MALQSFKTLKFSNVANSLTVCKLNQILARLCLLCQPVHSHSKGGFAPPSHYQNSLYLCFSSVLREVTTGAWCLTLGFMGDVHLSIIAMVFSESNCFLMFYGCSSPFWLSARHFSNSPALTPMLSYVVLGFSQYLDSCFSSC